MFTKEFQDIASIYIKDGVVIKARNGIDTSEEGILRECDNRNRVIVQKGNVLECYFKKEERFLIGDIANKLLETLSVDIWGSIEFK